MRSYVRINETLVIDIFSRVPHIYEIRDVDQFVEDIPSFEQHGWSAVVCGFVDGSTCSGHVFVGGQAYHGLLPEWDLDPPPPPKKNHGWVPDTDQLCF
jgi:hypothetical protein